MQIIKPLSLGLLHKPYRQFGKDHLVVASLGFFRLGEPVTRFLIENLQWPDVLKALPQGEPLDAVMPKPKAEYLLAAKACAPGGVPVPEMSVSVQVGDRDKQLRVYGNRQWRYGLLPWHAVDAPKPFTEMPISYQRAYGGEGHAANPVGVGYTGSRLGAFVGVNQGEMPNIEYLNQDLQDHHRQHPPAGFLPVDIRWQPRAGKLGTYDDVWLEQDFPGLARDLDWAAFNTAPLDQQFDHYLQGAEPYRLAGLHPQQAVIAGRLPDMRTRAFVLRKAQAAEECEEVELNFDTVWFFPEFALGVAVYRGQIAVEDSEAEDIQALMVGYEHNRDAAKTRDHYTQVLKLRLDPETCAVHALNDAQLTPLRSEQEQQALQQEQAEAEAAYLTKQQAQLDEVTADFWAQSGLDMPLDYSPPKAELPPLGLVTQAGLERADMDLSVMVDKAKALAEEAKQQHAQAMQQLEAERQGRLKPPPGMEAALQPDLEQQLKQAEEGAAKPTAEQMSSAVTVERATFDALLKKIQSGDIALTEDERQALDDSLAKLPPLQRQARRASPTPIPEAPAAQVAQHLGRLVREWLAAGESLAGRDLCGADLAGMDFSAVDLHEVLLEHADLRGCRFAGANLRGAVFTAAQLLAADFSGADLTEANLSQVQAATANFQRARLDKAMATEAVFTAADFSGASLCQCIAQQVDLHEAVLDEVDVTRAVLHEIAAKGSHWRRARGELAVFNAANLQQADLSQVRFSNCVMTQLQAEDSVWQGASLERVFIGGGAKLQGARLPQLRASHSSWRDADLRAADFSDAGLLDCDLGNADLSGGRLAGALFSRAVLMRARLCDCDARQADFFQALLRKADLRRADLRAANLVQANLFEAILDDADLRDAQPQPLGRAA